MTDNNYKAPESSLIDSPEPEPPERPRNVNIALCLIGGGALVQALAVLKNLQDSYFQVYDPRSMALVAADFAIVGVILYLLARGKSWARILLLILALVAFARLCTAIGYAWRQDPELWESLLGAETLVVRVLPAVMNFVALHLLYFSSGDWFRKT